MSIITRINKAEKRIVDLYNKLKNLPSGGVQSITGGLVNNTDPNNPIIVDAPADGTQYARRDGTWEEVTSDGGTEKQLKALIGTTSTEGNITVYTPLLNSIGLVSPAFTRVAPGIYSVTFSNTATAFTGTMFTHVGGNTKGNDSKFLTVYKINNTFYINCRNSVDGTNTDLTPNGTYALFFESL